MALEELWKLTMTAKDAVKDWTISRLKALDQALAESNVAMFWVNLPEKFGAKKEMTGEEALQAPGEIIKSITEAGATHKIPTWLLSPFILLVSIIGGLKTILLTTEVTSEKNVLQPLRKTVRPGLPDIGDVLQAEMREFIDSDKVKEILSRYGLTDDAILMLRKLTQYVPGAQDLVSFAVREAYDDGVAGRFGQDDNLGNVLNATKADRKRAGLTDEHFKRYWRAHWDLPSVNQAFEMLYRGAISEGDLDTLLRAKDIMPLWREGLKKISYQLLTRVDIRRMHKLGIMSETEVQKEYEKQGHSPDDARKLTQFTVQYNADPETSEQTETDKNVAKERDLTKGDITSALKSAIITPDVAKTMLTNLGYSSEEVELLTARVSRQTDLDYVEKVVDTYGTLYVKGLQTWQETEKNLQSVPVNVDKIGQLKSLWDLDRFARIDMPSKAEILRLMKKEIITQDKARELMGAINVPDEHQEWFIKDTLG